MALHIGAPDMTFGRALAAGSALYVQVLQPNIKLAIAWGLEVAKPDFADREKLGLRAAAFDPEHYSTNLFNLIIVEDLAALGKANASDLNRILVPQGCVLFRTAPKDFATDAAGLGMQAFSAGIYGSAFRKPALPPPEWKPCDMLKWKAGPGGLGEVAEIEFKDGMLSYADRMENEGDLAVNTGLRIVRDAYNGRTISREPLGAPLPDWYPQRVASKLAGLKPAPSKAWEERGQGGGWKAVKERNDGKLDLPFFGGHCFPPVQLGKYVLYHYNIWVDTQTNQRFYPQFAHPACQIGHVPYHGMIYNFPCPKPAFISGELALVPADIVFDHESGGQILQTIGAAPKPEPVGIGEWTMFRADVLRRNVCGAVLGDNPVKVWETQVGLGTAPYGIMCGERTGLTQAVTGYGLVFVADMDSERIVALNAADGKPIWTFHVGSRVDYPPTIHNGLCLFAARDGWVYSLDAKTGALVWRLLVPARERYIGWHEKLGSLWPCRGDVLIHEGIGYAAAGISTSLQGGVRVVAFRPETGEVLWRQCYHEEQTDFGGFSADLLHGIRGRDGGPLLTMSDRIIDAVSGKLGGGGGRGAYIRDVYLEVGNSLSRTMADLGGFLMGDHRLRGRIVASSDDLSVSHNVAWGGVSWESYRDGRTKQKETVAMSLSGKKDAQAKEPLWKIDNTELVADDIVITPQRVYVIGHYQRVKKGAEIWVLSREEGKVVTTVSVDGYPAFMGASAAGKRLFVATRDGKLICYENR
ncbi:MAG: PQQ-binding-like beta-propeller repeat protein [Planctomycetes bacterium]|nr:PQQ-binding-like beta-propeller repeat protein [Planctomycetota bacterium]